MNRCYLTYEEAEPLLKEGNVLFFSKPGPISFLVRSAGSSRYSHVGIVSTAYNERGEKVNIECLEFKEWIGSRATSLYNYIQSWKGEIDVYAAAPYTTRTIFDCVTRTFKNEKVYFRGRAITNEMRRLTGLPYGWERIWKIFKRKTIWYFWPYKNEFDDAVAKELIYPVCSSAIAYCFSKYFADLVPNKADEFCEPGNLANSSLLTYVFSLRKNQ